MLFFLILCILAIFIARTQMFFQASENQKIAKERREKFELSGFFSVAMIVASVICLASGIPGPSVSLTRGYLLNPQTIAYIYGGTVSLFYTVLLAIRWTKSSIALGE